MCAQWLSLVRLFLTPWTVALQAPLPMGLPRQECWSGLPFLSPLLKIEGYSRSIVLISIQSCLEPGTII